ncbi:hypothetical protein Bpfe_016833 [Biomphalaria pfeifferi]|uniref:Uncharacterized protein n=1 Tax=Biomphalaria pfeifferi TaxID=112525 RepID=A0AAD8F8F3_BIOPF|nr:hypothetical protein Bpfe_016833 [Biomphalaria pfeifferi]
MFKRVSVSFINKYKYAQILQSHVAEKVRILNCQRNFRFSRSTTTFGIKDSSKKWIIITGVGLAILSSGLKIKSLKASDSVKEENAGTGVYEETSDNSDDQAIGENDSEPLLTETNKPEIVYREELESFFAADEPTVLQVYRIDTELNIRTKARRINSQPENLRENAIFPGGTKDQPIIKHITKEQYEKCTEDLIRLHKDKPMEFIFSSNNEQGIPLAYGKTMFKAEYKKETKNRNMTTYQYEKIGNFNDAKNDFNNLRTVREPDRGNVLVGTAGNTRLNARQTSTYWIDLERTAPTLEIVNEDTGITIKLRYTPAENDAKDRNSSGFNDARDKKRFLEKKP